MSFEVRMVDNGYLAFLVLMGVFVLLFAYSFYLRPEPPTRRGGRPGRHLLSIVAAFQEGGLFGDRRP